MTNTQAHVYLIRHAESIANTNQHIIGGRSNESPLSPRGVEQAKALGAFITKAGLQPNFAYASPAVRTLETAEIALHEIGQTTAPIVDERLQELSQGNWTGMPRAQVYTPEVMSQIMAKGKHFKGDGGESMHEVGVRMQSALNEIAQTHLNTETPPVIHIYTHGLAIRCFASITHNWSHKKTFETATPNASLTYFTHSDDGWNLEFIGHRTSE